MQDERRPDTSACGTSEHRWVHRMQFGERELRNFAVCLTCGMLDEERLTSEPGFLHLRRSLRRD